MKTKWSRSWIRSKQPRKQRKYRYHAPLHVRHKLISAHLSPELREKYKKRSFPLRKGDKVKVMRGKFKGTIGTVERILLKKLKVYVDGVAIEKKDGSKVKYPLDPSNLMILELKLDDKKREEALMRK